MYEFLKGDRNKAMIRYKMDVNFFKTSDSHILCTLMGIKEMKIAFNT